MSSKISMAYSRLGRKRSSRATKRWIKGKIGAKNRKGTESPIQMVPVAHHHVFAKKRVGNERGP